MALSIKNLDKENQKEIEQVRKIFFQTSSRKLFISPEAQDKFFHTWTDYYLSPTYPGNTLLAMQNDQCVGYLSYAESSKRADDYYKTRLESYSAFDHLFGEYPAHLHINLTPACQGQGVGTQLISHCGELLKSKGIRGLHIITDKSARNVDFYSKNEFTFTESKNIGEQELLFMGRKL